MRLTFLFFSLFFSLLLISSASLANPNWKPFPYDNSGFIYEGEALKKNWSRLARAMGNASPFPDAAVVEALFRQYPDLSQTEAEADYEFTSQLLQEAWRMFYAGNFQEAKEIALSLGPVGHAVAAFAQMSYALYLSETKEQKQGLLEEALGYLESLLAIAPDHAEALFASVYIKARLSEELSAPIILARGYLDSMREDLDRLLAIHPDHIYGLALRGGIDAGIIRKVGKFVGRFAYRAKPQVMESYFDKSFGMLTDVAIIHAEYAKALVYVYQRSKTEKAFAHLAVASKLPSLHAMEYLDNLAVQDYAQRLREVVLNGESIRAFTREGTSSETFYSYN